jgi:hypothetical protein
MAPNGRCNDHGHAWRERVRVTFFGFFYENDNNFNQNFNDNAGCDDDHNAGSNDNDNVACDGNESFVCRASGFDMVSCSFGE